MSSNIEQQKDEIEALQSIYPDDFEIVSDETPIKYRITIPLIPIDNLDSEEEADSVPRVTFLFFLSETYPEEAPTYSLESIHLSRNILNELNEQLKQTCEDNLGDVVVFSLIQKAQEWYEDYLESLKKADEKSKIGDVSTLARYMTDEDAQLSNIKFGRPVTKELFMEWKEKFDEEMKEKREQEHLNRLSRGGKVQSQLTGRMYFEKKDSQWISSIEEQELDLKATEEHIDEDLFLEDDEED